MLIADAIVILAVLLDLPIVRPERLVPNDQFALEKDDEKLVDVGIMCKVPEPVNDLFVGFGASFFKTKVPSEIVVLPEKVLLFVRVSVPVPDFTKEVASFKTPPIVLSPLEFVI